MYNYDGPRTPPQVDCLEGDATEIKMVGRIRKDESLDRAINMVRGPPEPRGLRRKRADNSPYVWLIPLVWAAYVGGTAALGHSCSDAPSASHAARIRRRPSASLALY